MDVQCSYEGCKGSPKNSCSCDRTQKFCEYHIDQHLKLSGEHLINPSASTAKTSILLADEMKQLSSTMSKVMLTGKDMFQEICRKLCDITLELTNRQDKLIEMASNLSINENLPEESFKKLGDLGLNFKSADEFSKLINEHFSKDSANVDFSFFSKDIENIMNHLTESNSLLNSVSAQAASEAKRREVIETKIASLETSTIQIEQNMGQRINQIDSDTKERETRFADKDSVRQLEDKINRLEDFINHQNSSIEEVNLNFANINSGLAAQSVLNQEREMKLTQFTNNAQNQLNLQFAQLRGTVEQRVLEINQVLEANLKMMQEGVNKTNEEFRTTCDGKIDHLNVNFTKFCNDILAQVNGLEQDYQVKILDYGQKFTSNVRREIDDYKQFKVAEAERIRVEIEQEAKRKQEAEELLRKQQAEELLRKQQAEELLKKQQAEELLKKQQAEELLRKQQEDERKRKVAEEEEARRKKEEERILKQVIERKQREEEERKKKLQEERKNAGPAYSDFEAMNLDQKVARFKELFPDCKNWHRNNFYEIKMSNDGLYLFVCKTYSGMPDQIVSKTKMV